MAVVDHDLVLGLFHLHARGPDLGADWLVGVHAVGGAGVVAGLLAAQDGEVCHSTVRLGGYVACFFFCFFDFFEISSFFTLDV